MSAEVMPQPPIARIMHHGSITRNADVILLPFALLRSPAQRPSG
jgi:hypothetical protein